MSYKRLLNTQIVEDDADNCSDNDDSIDNCKTLGNPNDPNIEIIKILSMETENFNGQTKKKCNVLRSDNDDSNDNFKTSDDFDIEIIISSIENFNDQTKSNDDLNDNFKMSDDPGIEIIKISSMENFNGQTTKKCNVICSDNDDSNDDVKTSDDFDEPNIKIIKLSSIETENFNSPTKKKSQKAVRKLNKQLKAKNKWQCGYCDLILPADSPKEIKRHRYLEKVKRIRVHPCKVCGKKFDATKLREHILRHGQEKPAICELCGKGLSCDYNLQKHMMLHTGKRFVCDICKKSFTEKFRLKCHMNEHEKKDLFVCSTCGKTFLTRLDFYYHKNNEKVSQPNATFTCEKCGKVYLSKTNFDIHLASHEEQALVFSCPHCNKKYAHKPQLISHVWLHEAQYRCKKCLKVFQMKKLKTHECIPDPDSGSFKAFLPNECKICGKILKFGTLDNHMAKKHKLKECQYCGKKFLGARKFRFHVNSHELKCMMCDKGFTRKDTLNTHLENQVCLKRKNRMKN